MLLYLFTTNAQATYTGSTPCRLIRQNPPLSFIQTSAFHTNSSLHTTSEYFDSLDCTSPAFTLHTEKTYTYVNSSSDVSCGATYNVTNSYYRVSFPSLHYQDSFPSLHYQDSFPSLHYQDSFPSLHYQDSFPSLHYQDSFPSLHYQDSFPSLHYQDSFPSLHYQDSFPSLHYQDSFPSLHYQDSFPSLHYQDSFPSLHYQDSFPSLHYQDSFPSLHYQDSFPSLHYQDSFPSLHYQDSFPSLHYQDSFPSLHYQDSFPSLHYQDSFPSLHYQDSFPCCSDACCQEVDSLLVDIAPTNCQNVCLPFLSSLGHPRQAHTQQVLFGNQMLVQDPTGGMTMRYVASRTQDDAPVAPFIRSGCDTWGASGECTSRSKLTIHGSNLDPPGLVQVFLKDPVFGTKYYASTTSQGGNYERLCSEEDGCTHTSSQLVVALPFHAGKSNSGGCTTRGGDLGWSEREYTRAVFAEGRPGRRRRTGGSSTRCRVKLDYGRYCGE